MIYYIIKLTIEVIILRNILTYALSFLLILTLSTTSYAQPLNETFNLENKNIVFQNYNSFETKSLFDDIEYIRKITDIAIGNVSFRDDNKRKNISDSLSYFLVGTFIGTSIFFFFMQLMQREIDSILKNQENFSNLKLIINIGTLFYIDVGIGFILSGLSLWLLENSNTYFRIIFPVLGVFSFVIAKAIFDYPENMMESYKYQKRIEEYKNKEISSNDITTTNIDKFTISIVKFKF